MRSRVTEQTVGRLSLYRRLLARLHARHTQHIYSHELAEAAGVTAAQVRRDLMVLGCSGSPRHGYEVAELAAAIDDCLDAPEVQCVAVIGIGNLGRALLAFFASRHPNLRVVAGFDNDPLKTDHVVHGCRVYAMERLAQVAAERGIRIVMLTVPASEAQKVADLCVAADMRGILNFAPVPLHVPEGVYVSDVDLTMSLEKVAFFARQANGAQGKPAGG